MSILPHLEAQAQAQERERIRKSAAATPEKSPDSEQGERVQANDGIGYDGRTEEEIEEENRERNPKRKRDAEVRDLVWGLESLPKIEVEIEVLIQELDADERSSLSPRLCPPSWRSRSKPAPPCSARLMNEYHPVGMDSRFPSPRPPRSGPLEARIPANLSTRRRKTWNFRRALSSGLSRR